MEHSKAFYKFNTVISLMSLNKDNENYEIVKKALKIASEICVFTNDNINIENMVNKSRGDIAYTMIDTHSAVNDKILNDLKAIESVIKVTLYNE